MTDGIGRIFGGNSYGVGGYVPQRQEEDKQEVQKQPEIQQPETLVDPAKVMDFMASNNYFVAPAEVKGNVNLDAEAENRIANYMEQFEMIYGLVQKEFGEEFAPLVMDAVMDKLIGMAEAA